MDSNCQNGPKQIKAIRGIFSVKKRQKTVKNKVFEKVIAVGSVLVSMKNIMTNVLVVVIAAIYFGEVLVKMTNGKPKKSIFRRLHD